VTRLDALKELAAKVEAGECRQEEISCAAFDVQPTLTPWRGVCGEAYNGSLDAAKALHEAVLPGCKWGVGDVWSGVYWDGYYLHEPSDDNPARAWLLAILRALIAQEENT
jgi:hypothetical protein